jgi:hypothetical protein
VLDFLMEYGIPVVAAIIFIAVAVMVVEGALIGATFLANMWCV